MPLLNNECPFSPHIARRQYQGKAVATYTASPKQVYGWQSDWKEWRNNQGIAEFQWRLDSGVVALCLTIVARRVTHG